MFEVLSDNLRTLSGFGENERVLQHRLDEIADTFRAPDGVRHMAFPRCFDVARQLGDMLGHAAIAGGTDRRVGGVSLLHQGAEQTGVIR